MCEDNVAIVRKVLAERVWRESFRIGNPSYAESGEPVVECLDSFDGPGFDHVVGLDGSVIERTSRDIA
jgi:hypothetical protein